MFVGSNYQAFFGVGLFVGCLLFPLWLLFALVQFFAFADGMRSYFGVGPLVFGLVFTVCLFLGPLGGLVMSVVGFYGATNVWGWPWWQALLLVAPGLVLSFFAAGISGLASLFSRSGR